MKILPKGRLGVFACMLLASFAAHGDLTSKSHLTSDATGAQVNTQIEPDFRSSLQKCLDRAGNLFAPNTKCVKDEHLYQDKLLNENYRKLLRMLPKAERDRQRMEQLRWIDHTNKVCSLGATQLTDQEIFNSKYCMMYRTGLQARQLYLHMTILQISKAVPGSAR